MLKIFCLLLLASPPNCGFKRWPTSALWTNVEWVCFFIARYICVYCNLLPSLYVPKTILGQWHVLYMCIIKYVCYMFLLHLSREVEKFNVFSPFLRHVKKPIKAKTNLQVATPGTKVLKPRVKWKCRKYERW